MKSSLGIDCEDEKQLINKIQIMESKYKSVKSQCGKTGEGLTEDTIEFETWEGNTE